MFKKILAVLLLVASGIVYSYYFLFLVFMLATLGLAFEYDFFEIIQYVAVTIGLLSGIFIFITCLLLFPAIALLSGRFFVFLKKRCKLYIALALTSFFMVLSCYLAMGGLY